MVDKLENTWIWICGQFCDSKTGGGKQPTIEKYWKNIPVL